MSELEKLREKQQRRRQKRTLRIILISPVIALAFVAAFSLMTRIESVLVLNSTPYSAGEIGSTFSFSVGDSIFSVNRDKLSQEIPVSCPYVKQAEVSYRLPNRIQVTLTPAIPVLALRTEREVLLLDEDFKVLEKLERLPEGYLYVDGIELESYEVGKILDENENVEVSVVRDLLNELRKRGLYEATSVIDLSKQYNISMQIYDVITVYLGNSEDFSTKINALIKVLNENDLTVPAEIRVRNPSEVRYSRLP